MGIIYFASHEISAYTDTAVVNVDIAYQYPVIDMKSQCDRNLTSDQKSEIAKAEMNFAVHMSQYMDRNIGRDAKHTLQASSDTLQEVDCDSASCLFELALSLHPHNDQWLKPIKCSTVEKNSCGTHLALCCSLDSRLNELRNVGCPEDVDTIVKLKTSVLKYLRYSGEERTRGDTFYCVMPTRLTDRESNQTIYEISNKPPNSNNRFLPGQSERKRRDTSQIEPEINMLKLMFGAIIDGLKQGFLKILEKSKVGIVHLLGDKNENTANRKRRSISEYYRSGFFLTNSYNEEKIQGLQIGIDENAEKIKGLIKNDKNLIIQINDELNSIHSASFAVCHILSDINRHSTLNALKAQQFHIEEEILSIYESCQESRVPKVIDLDRIQKLCYIVTKAEHQWMCSSSQVMSHVDCDPFVTSDISTDKIKIRIRLTYYSGPNVGINSVITVPVAIQGPEVEYNLDQKPEPKSEVQNTTLSQEDVVKQLLNILASRNRRDTTHNVVRRYPYMKMSGLPDYFIPISNHKILGMFEKDCHKVGLRRMCPIDPDSQSKSAMCLQGVLANDARLIKLFCIDYLKLDHGAVCTVSSSPALEREYHKHVKIVTSHEPVERLSSTDTLWNKGDTELNCNRGCILGAGSQPQIHFLCNGQQYTINNRHNPVEIDMENHVISSEATNYLEKHSVQKFQAKDLITGFDAIDRELTGLDQKTVHQRTWSALIVLYVIFGLCAIGLIIYSIKMLVIRCWRDVKRRLRRLSNNIYKPRKREQEDLPVTTSILRG